MSTGEGLRRIVRVVSAVAWAALIAGVIGAASQTGSSSDSWALFLLGLGAFAMLQACAWVVAGFSGNDSGRDGLIGFPGFFRRSTKKNVGGALPAYDPGPSGVGGWLLLLVIALMALSPLRAIGENWAGFAEIERLYPSLLQMSKWTTYKTAAWSIILASAAVSFIAGYRLRNSHVPSSVSFAIGALWFCGPVSIALLFFASTSILAVTPREFFDSQSSGATVAAFLMPLAWTAYLKLSRRVRNTYYGRLYGPSSGAGALPKRIEPGL